MLNRRDFQVLEAAGVSRERLHFLPNPVPEIGELPDKQTARNHLATQLGLPAELPLFLYPVRGICRKNVGEMLLWAAAHRDRSAFGITLAPQNPRERPGYERWKNFAKEHRLPCWWELGGPGGLDFRGNLAAADFLLTTSVAEGFGMVFLEAWVANRELKGRNLPRITADFVEEGVRFPALYDRLNIPADWIGKPAYMHAFTETIHPLWEAYQLPPVSPAEIEQLVEIRWAEGTIDFGDLNEALQSEIIRRVHGDNSARRELLRLKPATEAGLEIPAGSDRPESTHHPQGVFPRGQPTPLAVDLSATAAIASGGSPAARRPGKDSRLVFESRTPPHDPQLTRIIH